MPTKDRGTQPLSLDHVDVSVSKTDPLAARASPTLPGAPSLSTLDRQGIELGIAHLGSRDAKLQEALRRIADLEDVNAALHLRVKQAEDSERRLRETKTKMDTILATVPALLGYWNRELRCEFASASYRDWSTVDPLDMIGMTMCDLLGEQRFRVNEPYARAALAGQAQRFERTCLRRDCSEFHLDARYLPDLDPNGEVRGFIALITDISALRRIQLDLEAANAQLKVDSVTDYLTKLFNRKVFSERSEEALRRFSVHEDPFGLILLDLDDFKAINDEFGHATGDEVLRSVGRVLQDSLREEFEVAARLGGEEFGLLCFGALDEGSLRQIAERVRVAVHSQTLQTAVGVVKITSSFGIALSDPKDTDWKDIYARADAALYRAKVGGKNRIEWGQRSTKEDTGRHRTPPARRG